MSDDQKISIQPHPATSNNPSTDPKVGGNAALASGAPATPGIQKLDAETANNLDKPLSKEELQKRTEELNK
ncbi:uncharacterized protein MJAP1_003804 [Malassezia japonica]|uniref:Uncharacterized protein n=1 Tax=Malassezia japonica TaxID=223818 RepID=A0AAF0JC16_9BASI|nr:uncharacterized protein MJAP1_003804 [Malassezia japonica]WFD40815.1 hypothetical protein MJAP1_003804 [Malassezia japonica]